jgi:hypothetical protein
MTCSGKIPRELELLFWAEQRHPPGIPEICGEYLGFQAKFGIPRSMVLFVGDYSYFSAKLLRTKSMRDTISYRKALPNANDKLV